MLVTLPKCASRSSLLLAILSLFDGLAEDRIDQEQDLAVRRLAALRHHVLVHVLAIGLHRFDALGVHDDGIGVGGGELPPPDGQSAAGQDEFDGGLPGGPVGQGGDVQRGQRRVDHRLAPLADWERTQAAQDGGDLGGGRGRLDLKLFT